MNIDQRARELSKTIEREITEENLGYDQDDAPSITGCWNDIEPLIKSAIQAVRDETIEEAVLACNHAWTKAGNRLPTHVDCIAEIRALKERKEP